MKDQMRILLPPTSHLATSKPIGFLKLIPRANILKDLFPSNTGCDHQSK